MARDTSKLVTIPGELHSAATGNIVTAAEEVFDYTKNMYQKDINQEVAYIKEDSSVAPIPSFNPQSQTVHLDEQVLSNVQKKQVRKNIGLGNGDIDSTPTSGSDNVVRSGGVYSSMQELRSTINPQVGYYTCSTAGNTAAKVIDASGYTLLKGGGLRVSFTKKNTAANATLNIEQTGAKSLYYNGVRVSTNNSWYAGEVMTLFYDGAVFQLNSLPDLDEYDVSARNGGQAFTFDEAVALVPEAYRHGGLKLRFISNSVSGQSSDNKYVQYFLTKDEWSLSEADWQKMNLEEEVSQLGQEVSELPVEKGTGTNSVQQKGTGAVAMSEASIATGVDSFAGQRGYKYTNTGNVTNQLTLTSVDGLAVGDVVSIVNNSKYPNCATITEINGNTITLDSLPFDSIVPDLTGFDDYLVYVSEKPNIGDVELAIASHAEGVSSSAQNYAAHAEGYRTKALGEYSHAEGRETIAQYASHAEGWGTRAIEEQAHAEGYQTTASGKHSHAEGSKTIASGAGSHAEGEESQAIGNRSHAEGVKTISSGSQTHTEGNETVASNNQAHAEGNSTLASGKQSHAEGLSTSASGKQSHAEGLSTSASGDQSHAEGYQTSASGNYTHAEGYGAKATNNQAHAEGNSTLASGKQSHAEGALTTASGDHGHAEGGSTIAGGGNSHAEGQSTSASGAGSHAEGEKTKAEGIASHAEGKGTVANNIGEHAEGQFNVSISGKTQHSVGIGTADNDRKNAFEIMQNGDIYVFGLGGYDGTNAGAAGVQTLQQLLGGHNS